MRQGTGEKKGLKHFSSNLSRVSGIPPAQVPERAVFLDR